MGFGETRTFQISIPSWWGFPWCLQSQTSCPGTASALEARLLTSVYSTLDYALSCILNQCVHVLLKYVCVCMYAMMCVCVCGGRGQLVGIGSFLLPWRFWEWIQVTGFGSKSLCSQPSHQPRRTPVIICLLYFENTTLLECQMQFFPIQKQRNKKTLIKLSL